jgi:hypothetical protein
MFISLLLASAVPVEAMNDATVWKYRSCLEQEMRPPATEGGVWETMPPSERKLSLVANFGRVIEFCDPERINAIERLREIVKARHPDWPESQVYESADAVANRLEVDMLERRVAPLNTSHGPVLDY